MSLMPGVAFQKEHQSHVCRLCLGNLGFGHHSCTEQGVRRGMVRRVGPSITFHEIKVHAPRGDKQSECLTPSGFLLPGSGITEPPTTGNQRFLFIYGFSMGFSASGMLCVGCTYTPWVMSLTLKEMRDCSGSFGIEQPLLWKRFGTGLHGAAVGMPLSKCWGSWHCSHLSPATLQC